MPHYKNRKPKTYKGCCGMCACKDHDAGVRNKRTLTLQELRADLARLDLVASEVEQEFALCPI